MQSVSRLQHYILSGVQGRAGLPWRLFSFEIPQYLNLHGRTPSTAGVFLNPVVPNSVEISHLTYHIRDIIRDIASL